jgi:uncharacterized protein
VDRSLLQPLFDFDWVWEVFTPEHKRRWGYYVLPVLLRDRLVGRLEPRIDRADARVRVLGLWWEEGFKTAAEDLSGPPAGGRKTCPAPAGRNTERLVW